MKPLPPWHSKASTATAGALADPILGDRRADAAEEMLGLVVYLAVEGGHEAERQPGRRLDLNGEVCDDVRHDRLIDERPLKGASVRDVVSGLRQSLPHQPGGAHGEVEPGVMVHLKPGADAAAGLADHGRSCERPRL